VRRDRTQVPGTVGSTTIIEDPVREGRGRRPGSGAGIVREMARVARPGSRILVFDETDRYVEDVCAKFPVTGRVFRNRRSPVTVPVDLVPPEMQEVDVRTLEDGAFHASTFRKPAIPIDEPS
jgi:hypothetical protein